MGRYSRRRGVQLTAEGGSRVFESMEQAHWTQEQLAEAAMLSSDTVKRFLGGQKVDRASVVAIAQALNLRPSEIIEAQNLQSLVNAGDKTVTDLATTDSSGADASEADSSGADATLPSMPANDGEPIVPRPAIEAQCYSALKLPGALVRLKAPRQMGKTSLISRVLAQLRMQDHYQTATLSFDLAESANFESLKSFMGWFCAAATQELDLIDRLDQYWKYEDKLACNYNATVYFQRHLIADRETPLVIVLDNTDRVFEHANIADDFCRLLRGWHDQAKRRDRSSQIWQKLRLVIVHATEVYNSLDINFSPLAGVGVVVDLPELGFDQVQALSQLHHLAWEPCQIQKLMTLVGGHPYLLQLAFDRVKPSGMTLDQLIAEAHTEAGIYRTHMRQLLSHLEQSSISINAFREVVSAEEPVPLKPTAAFKLYSMGLVQLAGNHAKPRCLLYRKYFCNCLVG